MNKIISYWNQNRGKIILVIITLAFLMFIIQFLNYVAKIQKRQQNNQNTVEEDFSQLPLKSIITGESVDKQTTEENVNLIEQFINLCNEAKTKEAYNMLTQECKEAFYTTEEIFIKNYYELIFTEKKLYGIKNYSSTSNYYTYEVKFYNDILSTGKMQDSDIYQDYITIDKKQQKISINSLIQAKAINKTIEKDEIQVTVLSKEVYKECEIYSITIKNNRKQNISLTSAYAIGDDNGKYDSFFNEITNNSLTLREKNTRNYRLKINKIYNSSATIESICFDNIIIEGENENITITIDV